MPRKNPVSEIQSEETPASPLRRSSRLSTTSSTPIPVKVTTRRNSAVETATASAPSTPKATRGRRSSVAHEVVSTPAKAAPATPGRRGRKPSIVEESNAAKQDEIEEVVVKNSASTPSRRGRKSAAVVDVAVKDDEVKKPATRRGRKPSVAVEDIPEEPVVVEEPKKTRSRSTRKTSIDADMENAEIDEPSKKITKTENREPSPSEKKETNLETINETLSPNKSKTDVNSEVSEEKKEEIEQEQEESAPKADKEESPRKINPVSNVDINIDDKQTEIIEEKQEDCKVEEIPPKMDISKTDSIKNLIETEENTEVEPVVNNKPVEAMKTAEISTEIENNTPKQLNDGAEELDQKPKEESLENGKEEPNKSAEQEEVKPPAPVEATTEEIVFKKPAKSIFSPKITPQKQSFVETSESLKITTQKQLSVESSESSFNLENSESILKKLESDSEAEKEFSPGNANESTPKIDDTQFDFANVDEENAAVLNKETEVMPKSNEEVLQNVVEKENEKEVVEQNEPVLTTSPIKEVANSETNASNPETIEMSPSSKRKSIENKESPTKKAKLDEEEPMEVDATIIYPNDVSQSDAKIGEEKEYENEKAADQSSMLSKSILPLDKTIDHEEVINNSVLDATNMADEGEQTDSFRFELDDSQCADEQNQSKVNENNVEVSKTEVKPEEQKIVVELIEPLPINDEEQQEEELTNDKSQNILNDSINKTDEVKTEELKQSVKKLVEEKSEHEQSTEDQKSETDDKEEDKDSEIDEEESEADSLYKEFLKETSTEVNKSLNTSQDSDYSYVPDSDGHDVSIDEEEICTDADLSIGNIDDDEKLKINDQEKKEDRIEEALMKEEEAKIEEASMKKEEGKIEEISSEKHEAEETLSENPKTENNVSSTNAKEKEESSSSDDEDEKTEDDSIYKEFLNNIVNQTLAETSDDSFHPDSDALNKDTSIEDEAEASFVAEQEISINDKVESTTTEQPASEKVNDDDVVESKDEIIEENDTTYKSFIENIANETIEETSDDSYIPSDAENGYATSDHEIDESFKAELEISVSTQSSDDSPRKLRNKSTVKAVNPQIQKLINDEVINLVTSEESVDENDDEKNAEKKSSSSNDADGENKLQSEVVVQPTKGSKRRKLYHSGLLDLDDVLNKSAEEKEQNGVKEPEKKERKVEAPAKTKKDVKKVIVEKENVDVKTNGKKSEEGCKVHKIKKIRPTALETNAGTNGWEVQVVEVKELAPSTRNITPIKPSEK